MSPSQSPVSYPDTIEVLIVDDHPAIHKAIELVLNAESDMAVVGSVRSRAEALQFINSSPPCVAIVDISLDNSYGLRLVREIADRSDQITLVVFSMFDERVYAKRAIVAGAQAYVMKQRPISHLVTAIRDALTGDIHVSPRMASLIVDSLAADSYPVKNPLENLSDRELAVFHLLGQGYTLSQISKQLDTSLRTIRTSRRKARKKLNLDSTSELLELAAEWYHHHATQVDETTTLGVRTSH